MIDRSKFVIQGFVAEGYEPVRAKFEQHFMDGELVNFEAVALILIF